MRNQNLVAMAHGLSTAALIVIAATLVWTVRLQKLGGAE